MLRTNLSTRPFYNERIIHLLIALAGVIILGITVFNAVRVVDLSRQNTDLSTRVGRDRTEGDRLRREAVRIRKGIDPKELTVVAAAAREANSLIDQRTFSWTAFFNYLEATLPPDVMRSYQDKADSSSWGGQNVYDVYSKAEGTGLDGTKYKDW